MQHTKGERQALNNTSKLVARKESSETEKVPDTEGIVFHPVVRRQPKTRFEESREAMRVVSPPSQDSSSSISPRDSLSGDESVDTERHGAVSTFTARRVMHRKKRRPNVKNKEVEKSSVEEEKNCSNHSYMVSKSSQPSSQCEDSESSSEGGCDRPHFSPPRSRRQRKLSPGGPNIHSRSDEPQGPKIVGILKKPQGESTKSVTSGLDEQDGERPCGRIDNGFSVSAQTSRATSATSSILTLPHGEYDGHSITGESHVSRDTITLSSASTTKRVRFSDNLESSLNSSQSSVSCIAPQPNTVTINSAAELWKRVLPNSAYNCYPPNGIFNPKMKISLSRRGQPKKVPPSSDHVTVHVPHVTEFLSNGQQQESRSGTRNDNCYSKKGRNYAVGECNQKTIGQQDTGKTFDTKSEEQDRSTRKYSDRNESLEHSPTDAQIDKVWDEIQMQLYGTDRVAVAPQVYQLQLDPQRGGISTRVGEKGFVSTRPSSYDGVSGRRGVGVSTREGGVEGGRETHHLPYRQGQKQLTCHGSAGHSRKSNSTSKPHPHQVWAVPPQQSYHHMSDLSHEEQRLMHSIEKINQRLKGKMCPY